MVIDSSALIALLLGEAETEGFVAVIAAASSRVVSAATYVETAIVMVARWVWLHRRSSIDFLSNSP